MSLGELQGVLAKEGFPRTCGDEPRGTFTVNDTLPFSPHLRG